MFSFSKRRYVLWCKLFRYLRTAAIWQAEAQLFLVIQYVLNIDYALHFCINLLHAQIEDNGTFCDSDSENQVSVDTVIWPVCKKHEHFGYKTF